MSDTDNKTIIYIMGYGRSGSTILDIILNNHSQITSVGALSNFFDWHRRNLPCACGEKMNECPFWKKVIQDFFETYPRNPDKIISVLNSVESGKCFFKLIRNKVPSSILEEYCRSTEALFMAIFKNIPTEIVVDSSKSALDTAGRVFSLAKYSPYKVKGIYLIRDGRGVMWSTMKGSGSPERDQGGYPRPIRAMGTITRWLQTNIRLMILERKLGNRIVMRVRYEDLIENPEYELRRIARHIGLDMEDLIEKIKRKDSLKAGHNLGGNRIRFNKEITLRKDTEWRRLLPSKYKILFWILSWPLARAFGYRFDL